MAEKPGAQNGSFADDARRPDDAPGVEQRLPISSADVRRAVREANAQRPPGVPPPTNEDYPNIVDFESAQSFPASDPPSGW